MSAGRLPIEPLHDAQALLARVEALKALLGLQLRQIDGWNARLYAAAPAGTAARRLITLKQAQTTPTR